MVAHSYRFLYVIDEGAYGVVHACQSATGAVVAIKCSKYWDDPQCKRLLLRELRVLQTLPQHPCTVSLIDAFRSKGSGRPHLVFELLERNLHQELDALEGRPMEAGSLRVIAYQVVLGLAHCHQHKVIHRDIKPANVLLSGQGCHAVAKVCDFGFARFVQSSLPGAHEPLSSYVVTRWYRAPEVIARDEYGLPSDIWSLGCTLAEAATGEPLFPGSSSVSQLARIMRCFGPLPPRQAWCVLADRHLAVLAQPMPRSRSLQERLQGVDPALLDVISACLALDPLRRPSAHSILQMPYFHPIPRLLSASPFRGLLQQQQQQQAQRQEQGRRQLVPFELGARHPDSQARAAAAAGATAHAAEHAAAGKRPVARWSEAELDPARPAVRMRTGQVRARSSVDAVTTFGSSDVTAATSEQRESAQVGSCRQAGGAGAWSLHPGAPTASVLAGDRVRAAPRVSYHGEAAVPEPPPRQAPGLQDEGPVLAVSIDAGNLPLTHMPYTVTEPPPMRAGTHLSLSGVAGLSATAVLPVVAGTPGGHDRPEEDDNRAVLPMNACDLSHQQAAPVEKPLVLQLARELAPRSQTAPVYAARWPSNELPSRPGAAAPDQQPSPSGDAAAVGAPVEVAQRRAASSTALGQMLSKAALFGCRPTCSSGDLEPRGETPECSAGSGARRSLDWRVSVALSVNSSARDSTSSLPLDLVLTSPTGRPEQQQVGQPRERLPHCRGANPRHSSLLQTGPAEGCHELPARIGTGSLARSSTTEGGLLAGRSMMSQGSVGRLPSVDSGHSPNRSRTASSAHVEESVVGPYAAGGSFSATSAFPFSASGFMAARASLHRAPTGLSRFAAHSGELQNDTSAYGAPQQALPPFVNEPIPDTPAPVSLRFNGAASQAAGEANKIPARTADRDRGVTSAATASVRKGRVQAREEQLEPDQQAVAAAGDGPSTRGLPARKGGLRSLLSFCVCGASNMP